MLRPRSARFDAHVLVSPPSPSDGAPRKIFPVLSPRPVRPRAHCRKSLSSMHLRKAPDVGGIARFPVAESGGAVRVGAQRRGRCRLRRIFCARAGPARDPRLVGRGRREGADRLWDRGCAVGCAQWRITVAQRSRRRWALAWYLEDAARSSLRSLHRTRRDGIHGAPRSATGGHTGRLLERMWD